MTRLAEHSVVVVADDRLDLRPAEIDPATYSHRRSIVVHPAAHES
jgi:hypothetical protein